MTARLTNWAGATESAAEPEVEPALAIMVADPMELAVASPELLTLTTLEMRARPLHRIRKVLVRIVTVIPRRS